MATSKCANCGAPLMKMINVDKRENGGRILWICGNIRNYARKRRFRLHALRGFIVKRNHNKKKRLRLSIETQERNEKLHVANRLWI